VRSQVAENDRRILIHGVRLIVFGAMVA
jgi:hypothetical protein